MRHVFNTRLAEAGMPEEKRALLVGHDDVEGSQRIYTHLGVAGIKDEVLEILDKVGRK
jgi:integrase/recombinase XerD